MTHYSQHPQSVRVDFFKETGKYYTTEEVFWDQSYEDEIIDAFEKVLKYHLKGRLVGMYAVCLEPYNIHAYPIMVKVK